MYLAELVMKMILQLYLLKVTSEMDICIINSIYNSGYDEIIKKFRLNFYFLNIIKIAVNVISVFGAHRIRSWCVIYDLTVLAQVNL